MLGESLVNPNYALFEEIRGKFRPNPNSSVNPNHLFYFFFTGKVLAKTIADGELCICVCVHAFAGVCVCMCVCVHVCAVSHSQPHVQHLSAECDVWSVSCDLYRVTCIV